MQIDKNARSSVKNLCPWTVAFTLPISKTGIILGAKKKTLINNEELIIIMENGNPIFAGTGNGNHARVFVDNDDIRKYVGYDSDDGKKQFILIDEECQRILDYKTFATFKKHVEDEIIANHEKANIINYARKIKLNDYEKISFLEQHCGIKFKEE